MNADLSYQPESGSADEIHFEQPSVWNSSVFTWVKFEDSNYNDWFGSFRGEPQGHLALSKITGLAAVPTSDATYIVNINKRELVKLIDSKYQIMKVALAPDEQTFVLASFYDLYRMSDNLELIQIPCQLNMDFIKFVRIESGKIVFEFEEIGNWKKTEASINTKNWTVEKQGTT